MIPEKNKRTRDKKLIPIPWALFLEKYPPGKMCPIEDIIEIEGPFFNIATPDLLLYCNHQSCDGKQTFKYIGLKLPVNIGKTDEYFLKYTCSNCKVSQKTFTVYLQISSLFGTNKTMKYCGK